MCFYTILNQSYKVRAVLWTCNYKSFNLSCEFSRICQNLLLMCRKIRTVCHHHRRAVGLRSEVDCELRGWKGDGTICKRWRKTHTVSSVQPQSQSDVLSKNIKTGQRSNVDTLREQPPRSLKSISHSPITYFDVYLRNSPWKPITHHAA